MDTNLGLYFGLLLLQLGVKESSGTHSRFNFMLVLTPWEH